MIVVLIQFMNDSFSVQQRRDFNRLQKIENFLKSDFFNDFQGESFYSKDLYERRNVLFIHDGFWTQFSQSHGKNISVENADGTSDQNRIYFDDNVFAVWHNGSVALFSETLLPSQLSVHFLDKEAKFVQIENQLTEGKWQTAYFALRNGELLPVEKEFFLYSCQENGFTKISDKISLADCQRDTDRLVLCVVQGGLYRAFFFGTDVSRAPRRGGRTKP